MVRIGEKLHGFSTLSNERKTEIFGTLWDNISAPGGKQVAARFKEWAYSLDHTEQQFLATGIEIIHDVMQEVRGPMTPRNWYLTKGEKVDD